MDDEELKRRLLAPQKKNNSSSTTKSGISKTPGVLSESISSYISNPTGKGSGYVAARYLIKAGLNNTFITLLRKYRKQFYAVPYEYSNGDILFLVKVPSEHYDINKISYDVIFFIKYDKRLALENRDIEVYSNCPAFVFTYAYVYNKNGLFFSKLSDKMPQLALTKAPEIRNPIQSMGFEKSTYIAARYLVDGHCLNDIYVAKFKRKMNPIVESDLFSKVADPETLIAIYQHAMYQTRKTHRKELDSEEKKRRDKANKDYAKEQKRNSPKGNFIFSKSPRSKITARKAQKNLMNPKKPKKKKK